MLISEIEHEVYGNHCEVKNVEEEDVPFGSEGCHIAFVKELGGDTCNVAEENKREEEKTLALSRSCSVGL